MEGQASMEVDETGAAALVSHGGDRERRRRRAWRG